MAKPAKNGKVKGHNKKGAGEAEQIQQIVRIGGGVMFALVALTLPYLYFSAATIENLSVNEPEKIKEVFFGGEPWVISCYEKDDKVLPFYQEASNKLQRHNVRMAVVNCKDKLPSGKTIKERMGMVGKTNMKLGRRIFFAGNGHKLKEYPKTNSKTTDALVDWSLKLAQLRVYQPATARQFATSCVAKKICAVYMKPGKVEDWELKVLRSAAKQRRNYNFAVIDTERYALSGDGLPKEKGPMVVLFNKPPKDHVESDPEQVFRTKAGWALNQDSFSESNLLSFVDNTVEVGFNKEGGLKELRKAPYIKDLRPAPKSKRKKHKRRPSPPPSPSPSPASSSSSTPSPPKTLTAEEKRAKEAAKRAKMDEEMGSMFEAADEDEVEGDDSEGDEPQELEMDEEEIDSEEFADEAEAEETEEIEEEVEEME